MNNQNIGFFTMFMVVQDNYALKYQVGITAPRNQGPKRLSEYQKAFAWKKGDLQSPLLAAEQVRSNCRTQCLLDIKYVMVTVCVEYLQFRNDY